MHMQLQNDVPPIELVVLPSACVTMVVPSGEGNPGSWSLSQPVVG